MGNPNRCGMNLHSLARGWLICAAAALSVVACSIISASAPAQAAVYYVAKTGNDTDPGTLNKPWKTIGKAATTLEPGDTVYIRAGVYKQRVVPKKPGKLGKFITYAAYPGEEVTIDGAGIFVPEWTGLVYLSNMKYMRVSGLTVINSKRVGVLADGSRHIIIEKNRTYNTVESGIAAWGSYDVEIDGNEVELACNDGQGECITVCGTDRFEVRFNVVHDSGPGSIGGEGITAKDGSSNGRVYGNHVHHINRLGIYADAWDKHTFNIEVFSNSVHDCGGDGLALASEMGGLLEKVKVFNNIAYRNAFVGIMLGNYGGPGVTTHPLKDITIVNNTVRGNGAQWGGGIAIDNPSAQNVLVRNNIFSRNLSFQIVADSSVPKTNYTVDHNLIDGFRGYEGEIRGSAYTTGSPLFVNPGGGNFHLKAGSPAIDKGYALKAPAEDYDGAFRPAGNGIDIGAFEYGAR